ncbi:MAG: hypothetical protein IJW00_06280 [Clostridia bacterium]|nr:hypothetical protein [Clostridia bacterium]
MKKYIVKRFPQGTCEGSIDWNVIPVARIDTYKWLEGYTPEAAAQLVYVEGEKFILRMNCAEKNPLRRYHEYNEPVYTDSCLEFFADYVGSGAYVNMEMNANGTLLSCIGKGRGNRTPIKDICHGTIFPTVSHIDETHWTVTAIVSLPMLADLYGTDVAALAEQLVSGYTFHGNFYKCGDETAIPHYGMWNPVGTEKADFHRPEYFGTLVIE